jgi:hypothetical protein
MARTLSKSDFKIARTCDAKLFFRENGYPTNLGDNPYLQLLAEGGYMVEALAKATFSEGIQLEYGKDAAEDYARTVEALCRQKVTLFEATLLAGRRQARVDILEKDGSRIRLFEVKAKSFNGAEHEAQLLAGEFGTFRSTRAPFGIRSEWEEKLEDITFQVLLLEKLLPGTNVEPYLILVDKSKTAGVDNVASLFELEWRESKNGTPRLSTAHYVGSPEQVKDLDLLTTVDVSKEVTLLRADVEEAAARFEEQLDAPLTAYLKGLERGSKCAACEFRVGGTKSGFIDCWGPLAEPKPHMLELYSIGTAKAADRTPLIEWMVSEGKAALLDIPEEGLVKANGEIGPQAERQRRQIEYTRRGEIFVGPRLRAKIETLQSPLCFIDFETSRLALPYHRGMRPYGLVAFQWSCHTLASLGDRPRHSEWLNSSDVWPNQLFAESLRREIGDQGPVLTWSHFEASILNEIIRDLGRFGRVAPDLVAWITDVFENRIIDLHEWARSDYFHPAMGGRTSIKVVLEALWSSDSAMKRQFEEWTGASADDSRDPYDLLPPIEIGGVAQGVREGTGAMRAYQEMMYGAEKRNPEVKARWAKLLRQYCALDTLSMVLILEHWRREVGLG